MIIDPQNDLQEIARRLSSATLPLAVKLDLSLMMQLLQRQTAEVVQLRAELRGAMQTLMVLTKAGPLTVPVAALTALPEGDGLEVAEQMTENGLMQRFTYRPSV